MEFNQTIYFTPLHIASRNGHTDIVKLLIDHHDINLNLKTISQHNFMQFSS